VCWVGEGFFYMLNKFPWIIFASSILVVFFVTMGVYRFLQNPQDTYPLATFTFVLSMITSILCTTLVPTDIYVTAVGAFNPLESMVVSQEAVQHAYLILFSSLLLEVFILVPFTFFYGEDRGSVGDVDEDADMCDRPWRAFRSTVYFIVFLFLLLIGGLAVKDKPSHGHEVEWVLHVLDAEHSGLKGVSFAIACMTLIGICLWTIYTAYGLVALPFEFYLGSQSVKEERRQIEEDLHELRGRHRMLEMRTNRNRKETKEIENLQREENKLNALNYKLQELEDQAMSWVSRLWIIFIPFRWIAGAIFFVLSLTIGVSLTLIVAERFMHSTCGLDCAYTLTNPTWINPADKVFTYASTIFPLDFVLLATVAAITLLLGVKEKAMEQNVACEIQLDAILL